MMPNYPVLIINKFQVKINIWSKDSHNAHLRPPYNNLKQNLCMELNINILAIFNIL